jgi:ribosomal-protein-alanine N-acetyltransferase
MHYRFIEGKRSFLSPVEREEFAEHMVAWANDPEVTNNLNRGLFPTTKSMVEEEYDQLARSNNDFLFGVIDQETDTFIGTAGLYSVNWLARSGEMRRFIGDKNFWNRGYGTELAHLMVAFGFERLNLNRIWSGVNVSNIGSWRSDEKVGFVQEGILRQELYRNGRYYDSVRFSILREEYFAHKEDSKKKE